MLGELQLSAQNPLHCGPDGMSPGSPGPQSGTLGPVPGLQCMTVVMYCLALQWLRAQWSFCGLALGPNFKLVYLLKFTL